MKLFSNREQQLLSLFSHDTDQAMDALYQEYADYLAGVCGRYVRGEDALKDVLQECFIKIFMQIGQFHYRGQGSLKAWMTRIVVNESIDSIRKEAAQAKVIIDREPPDLPDEPPDTDGLTADVIERMILELPPGYRTVFNLFAIEGRTHEEIARQLGIKPATSASQFHHAKKLLAAKIKDYKLKHRT